MVPWFKSPKTYFERAGMELKSVFLSDEANSQALDRYINVCTDVVFVDQAGCFVLAYRTVAAARGWWWKGGGMRKGETTEDSIARLMKREIGFVPENVQPLDSFFHQWEERAVEPKGNGQHDFIFLHFVHVDEDTIAKIRLDSKEYDVERGFMRYNGTQVVRPAIAGAYRLYRQRHIPVETGFLTPERLAQMHADPSN